MIAPDLFLYKNISWLVFSRVRPVHTNGMIFGFVGSALMGAALLLCAPPCPRAPSQPFMGRITAVDVEHGGCGGQRNTSFRASRQGREYAEYIWPIDILVLLAFAMTFYNVFMTVRARKEKLLYVSVWYVFAALIFIWWIYFFGNAVWHPDDGGDQQAWRTASSPGSTAMASSAFSSPRSRWPSPTTLSPSSAADPLFSHTISLVGFWSILIFYPHIGGHHLLQTPIPTWLKVVSVTGSVGMLLPVLAVLINLWLTMKGRLATIHANIGGKWVFAGLVWYLIVCLQGPFQSLPIIQRVTHLTNWVVGHSHIAVLGFSGFIGIGAIYFLIPRMTGRPLYSTKLADIQYWLLLIGLGGFWFVPHMRGAHPGEFLAQR